MKPKTMVLMVVAIVCGLGASYMTARLLAERGDAPEAEKIKVVIAKQQLSVGHGIKKPDEMFELKEFTKGDEPKDSLLSFEQLKGKYLKRNLRKGDFVTTGDIDDTTNNIDLPPGTVGVGIRVTAESIASGFAAQPNSRVNIIWTIKGGNGIEAQTVTLLENVLVVAADITSAKKEEKNVFVANVVTVALSDDDAQKVQLAKDHGTLSLVLRNPDDDVTVSKTKKLTLTQLLAQAKPTVSQQPDPGEVKPPEPPKVETPVVKEPSKVVTPPVVVQPPVVQPKIVAEPPPPAPTKKKHTVVIHDSSGKTKTQTFWIYENGDIRLDGHEPEAADNPPAKKQKDSSGPATPVPAPSSPGAGSDLNPTPPNNNPLRKESTLAPRMQQQEVC